MSNTRRMTVNVPVELYDRCSAAIDGVYLLNMSQLVLVAMSDLVAQKQSPPLPSSPLHPPTPNTPPIISPKGDIYTPPNSPPKKRRSKPGAPDKYSKDFEAFWDVYPRKIGKRNAWKAYFASTKIAKPEDILEGLEASIKARDWATAEMKFIPHASTWLNGRRWEDTFDAKPAKRKASQPQEYVPPVDYRPALNGESCEYWNAAKEDILDEVGAYDFQSWFEPCRAILVKDTLVIGCPDQAHAGWLMQNYREELTAAIEVRFRVVDAEEFSSYVGGV